MSWDMLLHPELMSNEQLINIIQQRYLKVPNIQGMQRDDLLNLFHQFCVPYGQRKCGRGKVLNKSRNISPESKTKLNSNNSTLNNNSTVVKDDVKLSNKNTHHTDRLKPPPDLLSGHMKRIKLDTKSVYDEPDKFKRKVPIDPVTQSTECPPAKKERKPITWP